MANYYSSAYSLDPFRGATTYQGVGAFPDAQAKSTLAQVTFSVPNATVLGVGDVIHLCPAPVGGAKVARCAVSTDPTHALDAGATLVVNLGWLSNANGTGVATAFGPLRAAATTASVTDAQVNTATGSAAPSSTGSNGQAAGAYDELVLYVTTAATSTGSAGGTCTALIELIVP